MGNPMRLADHTGIVTSYQDLQLVQMVMVNNIVLI